MAEVPRASRADYRSHQHVLILLCPGPHSLSFGSRRRLSPGRGMHARMDILRASHCPLASQLDKYLIGDQLMPAAKFRHVE